MKAEDRQETPRGINHMRRRRRPSPPLCLCASVPLASANSTFHHSNTPLLHHSNTPLLPPPIFAPFASLRLCERLLFTFSSQLKIQSVLIREIRGSTHLRLLCLLWFPSPLCSLRPLWLTSSLLLLRSFAAILLPSTTASPLPVGKILKN